MSQEAVAGLIAGFLVLQFTHSTIVHLSDGARFHRVLVSIGLSPRVAPFIPVVEGLTVVTLLVTPRVGALLAGGYVSIITAILATRFLAGKSIEDCGCASKSKPVDAAFFLRNGLFMLMSFVSAAIVPAGWEAGTTAALLAAVGIGVAVPTLRRPVVVERRSSAEPRVDSDVTTRRELLSWGARGAGLVSLSAVGLNSALASQATTAGDRRGIITSRTYRIGVGSHLRDVRNLQERFDIHRALQQIPGAAVVDWEHSLVEADVRATDLWSISSRTVWAPVIDESGKGVALLSNHRGDVTTRPGSPEVTLEQRLQILYRNQSGAALFLMNEDGRSELRPMKIRAHHAAPVLPAPLPTPGPEEEVEEDYIYCMVPILDELPDLQRCGNCSFYNAEGCDPREPCYTYKCRKCRKCGQSGCRQLRCCDKCFIVSGPGCCKETADPCGQCQ